MPTIGHLLRLKGTAAAAILLASVLPAHAQEDDAKVILKAMSDYLSKQQAFSFDYQSAVEVVTTDFEKLQFVSSGTAVVNRPDKARISRRGGFVDLDLSYDGKQLVVDGKNLNVFAKVEAKGTLDQLFDLINSTNVGAPGADLFGTNAYALLTEDLQESKHISSAVVNGVDCEYLTFRTDDVDWQIWIASGDKPVPLRYVVTTKYVSQAPQYTLEVSNFKTGTDAAKASFTIEIPKDAKEVSDISEIEGVDELPVPGLLEGHK